MYGRGGGKRGQEIGKERERGEMDGGRDGRGTRGREGNKLGRQLVCKLGRKLVS